MLDHIIDKSIQCQERLFRGHYNGFSEFKQDFAKLWTFKHILAPQLATDLIKNDVTLVQEMQKKVKESIKKFQDKKANEMSRLQNSLVLVQDKKANEVLRLQNLLNQANDKKASEMMRL